MRLQNRVAIVTGASSGIGRGIALGFAAEGARVVVCDIVEQPKQGRYHERQPRPPTAEQIESQGGDAIFVKTDISDEVQVAELIRTALRAYGQIDILVNNAGIFIPGDSSELGVTDWERIIDVNLRAVFLTTRAVLPELRRSQAGRIINVSSVLAFAGGGGPAYSAAKAGVVNLTRDSALEAASHGVTVNCICPGYIETPIQDYQTQESIQESLARTPLGRLGKPSDIASAAVFLASDEAAWITGVALPVDGGWTARF